MKIYIGFSSPTSKFVPFAWAIQAIEKRPYDHAYIRMQEPMNDEWMIFQASKQMVNMYHLSWFLKSNEVIKEYEIDCTDLQYKELWAFAMKTLGTPYSIKQVLAIFLRKLFHFSPKAIDGEAGEVCSELAARVAVIMGLIIDEEFDFITPSDLDYFLSQHLIAVEYPDLKTI